MASITAVALTTPPLDQLTALGGATGGAILIYIAPSVMTLSPRGSPRSL